MPFGPVRRFIGAYSCEVRRELADSGLRLQFLSCWVRCRSGRLPRFEDVAYSQDISRSSEQRHGRAEIGSGQFPSGVAAQTSASPAEVMRGQVFNGCPSGAFLDDVPYDPLRYAVSRGFACAAHAPKHAAFAHARGYKPRIDGVLDPIWNRHRSNMPRLADQIDYDPAALLPLN
jgi:hypothetical protein